MLNAVRSRVIVTEIIAFQQRLSSAGFLPVEVMMAQEVYDAIQKEIGQQGGDTLLTINGMPIQIVLPLSACDGWSIAVKKS